MRWFDQRQAIPLAHIISGYNRRRSPSNRAGDDPFRYGTISYTTGQRQGATHRGVERASGYRPNFAKRRNGAIGRARHAIAAVPGGAAGRIGQH